MGCLGVYEEAGAELFDPCSGTDLRHRQKNLSRDHSQSSCACIKTPQTSVYRTSLKLITEQKSISMALCVRGTSQILQLLQTLQTLETSMDGS
jgi:hypothetical protein